MTNWMVTAPCLRGLKKLLWQSLQIKVEIAVGERVVISQMKKGM